MYLFLFLFLFLIFFFFHLIGRNKNNQSSKQTNINETFSLNFLIKQTNHKHFNQISKKF
uniref:Uncharacterized protein n=1 Tax=Siphoviridae sp. ctpoI7 TaxID=2825678 RepID=A0A8S5P927_9CAUD|nr:MAG TPA: hypothetical protein [Siphoviridae sp. ctpoI7]